ncbi:ricin-type beta-trefoil lectin domain protein [Actinospica durhamensis]|uniref:1-phosphatidylinositol phosphodiesterase n=1 Tax=Actinospica durhamensis TaxID=1508375 RepID=A0A941ESP2_9ACTN|nr:phosphatidylinositol-specific phospholipase C domain-containing protein [Actinospica durhamensis]MBR7835758.1 ricin-type beta-trefoil lectin domain protein [Actinospica durhamensis]
MAALTGASLGAVAPALADATPAYSHDSSIGLSKSDWMSWLPATTPLSQLTLPGTHDSGAYVFGGDVAETQSMNLETQLSSGIRAWDIRLKVVDGDRLEVYHGVAPQGLDFQNDVLRTADAFLDAHRTETLLMRIKNEGSGSSLVFANLVRHFLDQDTRIYRGTSDNPSLGEIRGKIVILQNFISTVRVGLPWYRAGVSIQDDHHLTTNWDLATKWWAIDAQLKAADSGPADTAYVNFLSASGGSFPYFVASGHSSPGTNAPNLLTGWTRGAIDTCGLSVRCIPQYPSVNCFAGLCSVAFVGTNVLTMREIDSQPDTHHRYGIVYADFPGSGLIQDIIAANGTGMIVGVGSGRCIDYSYPLRHLQLWDCHDGVNQRWKWTTTADLKLFGSDCMSTESASPVRGSTLVIQPCNGRLSQKWVFTNKNTIVSISSGLCVDADQAATGNGTRLQAWPCNGGSNQEWLRR